MSLINNNNEQDTFLSDWMDDKISDDQLKQLVSETDFVAFKKLKNSLATLHVSNPDMEKNYALIQSKIVTNKNQKTPKVFPLYRYAIIAASLLLFFGWYQVFVFSNTIFTDYGKTVVAKLSDNSSVILNAKSKISYPTFFNYNRTVKLEGEAFFEVKKGNTFTVQTSQGKVTVLGTKFNVIVMSSYFEVHCYEGKVEVSNSTNTSILNQGDVVRFYNNQMETLRAKVVQKPEWISGESTFKNAPFEIIINQLENQYNYKINCPNHLKSIKFTGSFSHQDIEIALKSICIPLNLKYTIINSKEIRISE